METYSHTSQSHVKKAALATAIVCLLTDLIASGILFWQIGKIDTGDLMVILILGSLFAFTNGIAGFIMGLFLIDWPTWIAYIVTGLAGVIGFWLWIFTAGFWIFGSTTEHLSIPAWRGWLSGSIAGMLSLVTFLAFFKKYPSQHTVSGLFYLIVVEIIIISLAISASFYFFGQFT
ncbi:MAG TPA: hypothetical protein EYP90_15400 [Chromatiaceae bacterium]|nr:hypothetical protein [Chromatiaceae bacterium]